MKRLISTFIIILATGFTCLNAKDYISIKGKCPFPEGTKVFFEGYQGFQKVELGSIRITENGGIDYFMDYHGYCVMSAEGQSSWPLILEYDPTCLEWDSIPSFPCDPENEFFYKMMPSKLELDSLVMRLEASNDSLEKVNLNTELDLAMVDFRTHLQEGNSLHAKIFLEAELLVMESGLVETTQELVGHKTSINEFIISNFDIVVHSDALIALAQATTGMNKKIFRNSSSLRQAQINEVGAWVNMLGSLLGEKAVVDFFLIHFVRSGETDVASDLVGKYAELVKCDQYVSSNQRPSNMPYTFSVFGGPDLNIVYNLDQFSGITKILAIYSTDCPSSIAAVVGLYGFMREKQVRMPVILVPNEEPEGEYAKLIEKEAPFGLQTGMKTGSGIVIGAGVKQLPAFITLDGRNLLKEIYYNINELKIVISGD